ncbi:hypothetical protein DFH09DRAFT_1085658 [Mycena vulgaris]|nr:hypothetical protein DFH09DRAFT_1085658 [Mycena vulgaris]
MAAGVRLGGSDGGLGRIGRCLGCRRNNTRTRGVRPRCRRTAGRCRASEKGISVERYKEGGKSREDKRCGLRCRNALWRRKDRRKEKKTDETYLDGLMIHRVHTIGSQSNPQQQQHGAVSPRLRLRLRVRLRLAVRRRGRDRAPATSCAPKTPASVIARQRAPRHAVSRDGYTEPAHGIRVDERSVDGVSGRKRLVRGKAAHLNAPAAALGPNHMPTSLPAASAARSRSHEWEVEVENDTEASVPLQRRGGALCEKGDEEKSPSATEKLSFASHPGTRTFCWAVRDGVAKPPVLELFWSEQRALQKDPGASRASYRDVLSHRTLHGMRRCRKELWGLPEGEQLRSSSVFWTIAKRGSKGLCGAGSNVARA